MDWTGPNQGKLRKALLEIYGESDIRALKRFIRDSFTCSLSDIGGNSPADWAEELIEKSVAEGWIKELYLKVCVNNQGHSAIQKLQRESLSAPFVKGIPKVDAGELFANFSPYDDFAIVQKAFLCACREALCDFRQMRPDHPPLTDLAQIQELIESYQPELAVRFAAHVMVEFQKDGRGLTAVVRCVEQWRDRIANQHNIPLNPPPPAQVQQQGYLLVALQERAQNDSFIVYSELHVTDEKDPVPCGIEPVILTLDEVPQHLSALIHQAEEELVAYGSGRITLELFLPWNHLNIDVARWEVLNKRGRSRPLGKHRSFVIRSYDRAVDPATQAELKRKWRFLTDCEPGDDLCDRFHLQETCPTAGDLLIHLKDKPGLRLLAECPEDPSDYLDILNDIIDSAVPMALWFCAAEDISTADRLTAFDSLLTSCCGDLTDFSKLADQRERSSLAASEHFRLLCDRPDRWPTLPSNQSDLLMTP
jgi:hypothetical protein